MHSLRTIGGAVLKNSSAFTMRQLKIPADEILIISIPKEPAMWGSYSENCF